MTDKHRVVVAKCDLDEYESKGYSRAQGESLAAHVGAGWELLPPEERAKLVLVEIEAGAHRKLNTAAPAYVCSVGAQFIAHRVELLRLDCIAEQEEDKTLASVAGSDEPPRWFLTFQVAETPRGAVGAVRPELVQAIAEHRRIADELESFLIGMECL